VDVLLLLFWGTALSTARTLFGGTLIIMLIVDGATLAFVAGHPNSSSCFARLLLSSFFFVIRVLHELVRSGVSDPCFGAPVSLILSAVYRTCISIAPTQL
jgi:hypothetical protein